MGKGIGTQGYAYENYLALQLPAGSRLPANFKTFDFFDDVSGLATSAKALDTGTVSRLSNPGQIYLTLTRYINKTASFDSYTLKGLTLEAGDIASMEIRLGIPYNTNAAQWNQIYKAIDYSTSKNINLVIDQIQ